MKKVYIILLVLFSSISIGFAQGNMRQEAEKYHRLAKETEAHMGAVHDSVRYYRNIISIVQHALKSDEYDRKPDRKRKIEPKLETANKDFLIRFHPQLIDAGKYLAKNTKTNQEGIEAFKLYLSSRNSPLLREEVDETGVAAYYLAYYYLQAHDLKQANDYADEALKYDRTAQVAAEIKAECMHQTMTNAEDSTKYLAVLSRLYRLEPTNKKYFSWIMRFYEKPTPRFNIEDFVDSRLEKDANSPIPWILKGEIAMNAERWEEAIEAYKQADEIDPTNIPLIYNIGVCLNQQGNIARSEVLARRKKGEIVSDIEYTKYFADARNYLERVRAKDPRRNKVDWVSPLYLDYQMLDDKIKAKELEPLVSK